MRDRVDAPALCSRCRAKPQMEQLSAEDLQRLDGFILRREILPGIVYIKDRLQLALSQSQAVFVVRYEELRTLKPGEFSQSHDKYWEGFYS